MTALAEAVLTAQRQAIAALSKAYLANDASPDDSERITTAREGLRDSLNAIGCRDTIEQDYLLTALEYLRQLGAQAPAANGSAKPDTGHELASADQMRYAQDLADKAGTVLPDYTLTKGNASKLIDQLKAGTYNADEWTVSF
jgi:hypothetical protein